MIISESLKLYTWPVEDAPEKKTPMNPTLGGGDPVFSLKISKGTGTGKKSNISVIYPTAKQHILDITGF